jgi:prepilin-type N-terminal cleavage/methylation domain-containing protein
MNQFNNKSPHQSTHRKPLLSRQAKGFTLIELLTVIAVIGILAGIIITALPGVLLKARTTTKISNYRQLYMITQLYTTDHKGEICPAHDRTLKEPVWTTILSPYLNDARHFEEIYIDPFWEEYNPEKGSFTGVGMTWKPLLPESNTPNRIDSEKAFTKRIKLISVTEQPRRIMMADSAHWHLNGGVDTTRHEGGTKGMCLLFDGQVVLYTASQAQLGLEDPAKLRAKVGE